MIDFGLSAFYIDRETHKHVGEGQRSNFVGTAGFSSLNSHMLKEQSRRDDLEALAYVMIYLRVGQLPWHRLPGARTCQQRYNMIVKKKFATKPEDLIT